MKVLHKGYKPLCYVDGDKILTFKNNNFYIYNISQDNYCYICKLSLGTIQDFLAKIRLTQRILRLEPRSAIHVCNGQYLVSYRGFDYLLNTRSKELRAVNSYRKGMSSVLSYSRVEKINSAPHGIYYGEYFYNLEKEPVSIFYFDEKYQRVEEIYKFKKGQVNHIHYVLEDEYRNRIWIFTGDFDAASAIWYTDDGFKTVKPFAIGSQAYRACKVFVVEDGLIYATDTPLERNYIRKIVINGDKLDETDISEINGSCIYGAAIGNFFIWSTSVEPAIDNKTGIRSMFSYKLGEGIKSWNSDLICYDKDSGKVKVIRRYKKDILPMRLCQFGTLMFPEGKCEDYLVCYGSAIVGVDGQMMVEELGGINNVFF